jgi:hypothetical protein
MIHGVIRDNPPTIQVAIHMLMASGLRITLIHMLPTVSRCI